MFEYRMASLEGQDPPAGLRDKVELFVKTFMENMQLTIDCSWAGGFITPEQDKLFKEQTDILFETGDAIMEMGYQLELVPIDALPPEISMNIPHVENATMEFVVRLTMLPQDVPPKNKLH